MDAYVPPEVQVLLGGTLPAMGLQLLDTKRWALTDNEGAAMLGKGSFGYVFAVRHKLDKHEYALKVVNMTLLREVSGMADNSKMRKEVETLAKLQHGHYIARYFDAQEVSNTSVGTHTADFLIIRLELCKGGTLQNELKKFADGMPVELVRKLFTQMTEAFSFMADKRIVHRDFKPDNVCLSVAKGDCRLVDLGFAREYGGDGYAEIDQSNDTTLFEGRGNKRYRSPENGKGLRVDHKDDMWALGLVLCEMLSGQSVCKLMGGDYATLIPNYHNKLEAWIKSVKKIDRDLGGIAQNLLLHNPEKRFSAKQVLVELELVP